jgi:hypothetical protein
MAMRGTAALAMWWDMSAGMRHEFEHWHTHEHFPERLAIPGFLRASRWTDADGGEGVFVLYELQSFAVLSSAPYLARLNAPTPWSTSLMPHHRNMVRAQSHVVASCGGVVARYATTFRFSLAPDETAAVTASLVPRMRTMSEQAGLVGAHLLRHETPDIALTTEQKIRGARDKPGDWVLIVCGYARQAVQSAVDGSDGERQTFALSYSAIGSDVEDE